MNQYQPPGSPGYGPAGAGYHAPPAAPPHGGHGGGYEFNEQENARIGLAATFTKVFGAVSFIAGGIGFLLSFVPLIKVGLAPQAFFGVLLAAVGALISIGIGYIYFSSGQAFSRVVDTQGDDIAHLMDALSRLRSAFRFEVILIAVGFALIGVAMIILLVVFGTAAIAGSVGAFR